MHSFQATFPQHRLGRHSRSKGLMFKQNLLPRPRPRPSPKTNHSFSNLLCSNNSQVMVSHPNSNCLNSIDSWHSNHSNTINYSNSSLPPPYQIRLINPPLPLHKRSSTILRLTMHRYPNRLLCLNNRSIRQLHLLPRAHTTILFHSDHHRSLRHSHRGPSHRQ